MKKYVFLLVLALSVFVFTYFNDDTEKTPARPVLRIGMEFAKTVKGVRY